MQRKKIALITGASRGLGREIAIHLAKRQVEIILVARDKQQLHETKNAIAAVGSSAHIFRCDLTQSVERKELVDYVQQNFASLDFVVHNAAVLVSGPLTQISSTAIRESVTTNLIAAMELSRDFFTRLAAAKGVIAFIASTTSHVPMPYNSIYTATKFAIHGFAKTLHYEAQSQGIRVFTTYPPAMYTDMTQGMAKAMKLQPCKFYACGAVAQKIVRAILKRKAHLNFYTPEYVLTILYQFFPRITTKLLEWNRKKFAIAMKENIK
ncbi:SDR family NAD(P)-dependent oxidoreductase [Candidatus Uabimicrobium amorphum]|uniref:3-oxoacyl-ACP reductase n=1 Tax=Uabimicrobium amorphum TaxID=2596890 RepID=A0A5S9IIG7_UABAM|nr:SDR family oxidoreductase [Candidatus Uabimicrobium amorphum]BBM82076.1 3-oxoacyl-ACP reductase [Candidatus Uabimicrobium amorphum]